MAELINSWQFFVVLYVVASSFYQPLFKHLTNKIDGDGTIAVQLQLIAGLFSLLLIPFFPFSYSTQPATYFLLAIACIFYAIFTRLQVTVREHVPLSLIVVLMQLNTVLMIVSGIIFFQEKPTAVNLLGAFFILIGNVILLWKGQHTFSFNKHFIFLFISLLFYASAITIDVSISSQFNLPFYLFLTLTIPALGNLLLEPQARRHFKPILLSQKWLLLGTGIAWYFFIFFALRAYQLGEVSKVIPLHACSVLLNILLGRIIFKEKNNVWKTLLAALLVIIGVFLTAQAK